MEVEARGVRNGGGPYRRLETGLYTKTEGGGRERGESWPRYCNAGDAGCTC